MARTECKVCKAMPVAVDGRCITCYQYLRRTGNERSPELCKRQVGLNETKTLEALMSRFGAKVQRRGDGCWEWTGARSTRGYGRFNMWGTNVYAHRFAYQMLVGPIFKTHELDHLCRNHWCVNPEHLEPVTHRDNVKRGALCDLRQGRST